MTSPGLKSLDDYYNFIFWANYAIYFLYFLIKYVAGMYLLVMSLVWFAYHKGSNQEDNAGSGCNCGKKVFTSLRWVVLQLFGGPLGIVERHKDAYRKDELDEKKIPTLYIRNKKLSHGDILVLSVLIISFGVLTLISAVNLSLLRVTHVCSEDPHIDCYAELIDGANDTIVTSFNISIDTSEPLSDCSFWNSEGVSSQVTFTCFQFVVNIEAFIAAVGGLLQVFLITMKVLTGIFLTLNECCSSESCDNSIRNFFRCIAALFATLFEVILAITCIVLVQKGTINMDNPLLLKYFSIYASDFLIFFGVFATLLWLPWEDYAKKEKNAARNELQSIPYTKVEENDMIYPV